MQNNSKVVGIHAKVCMHGIINLSLPVSKKSEYKKGFVYSKLNKNRDWIEIGYVTNLDWLLELNKFEEYVVSWRNGRAIEVNYLKSTLKELGYKESIIDGRYGNSKRLLNHLDILCWPRPKFSKEALNSRSIMKKYSN